ncbi:MAG: DUF3293 domain-containing protein [Pirellula sp.]
MHPAYFETRFRLESPVGRLSNSFAIVSAYATTGQIWTDERNRMADESLKAKLIQIERPHHRIVGYSPRTQHAQPSWLIEVDEPTAVAIGLAYHQDAIYVVEADALWVVRCVEPSVRSYIGSFRERLDGVVPLPPEGSEEVKDIDGRAEGVVP